jgi:hypothetical protein
VHFAAGGAGFAGGQVGKAGVAAHGCSPGAFAWGWCACSRVEGSWCQLPPVRLTWDMAGSTDEGAVGPRICYLA